MSLRVLLADESSTIKKAINRILQDYFVEVRAVPVGVDVLTVAKSFQPEIIFVDVLLPKKNGYEVCGDLKNDPETSHIPVILMWSGFLELDDQKLKAARPDAKLEKPFESQSLHQLVEKFVPKIKQHPLKDFFSLPPDTAMIEPAAAELAVEAAVLAPEPEPERPPPPRAAPKSPTPQPLPPELRRPYAGPDEPTLSGIEMEGEVESKIETRMESESDKESEEVEEFVAVPVKVQRPHAHSNEVAEEFQIQKLEDWRHKDLASFRLDLSKMDLESGMPDVVLDDSEIRKTDFVTTASFRSNESQTHLKNSEAKASLKSPSHSPKTPIDKTDHLQIDHLQEDIQSKIQNQVQNQIQSQIYNQVQKKLEQIDIEKVLDGAVDEALKKYIRSLARDSIEAIIWKFIPEIAEKVIRDEISKLLEETEKSVQGSV